MRRHFRVVAAVTMALACAAPVPRARAESQYAPGTSTEAFSRLRLKCHLRLTCPLSSQDFAIYRRAIEGDHEAEFQMGERLKDGHGMTADINAAADWYGRAAEGGSVRAARALNRLFGQGIAIHADNRKIATAIQAEARTGNAEAGRVLADMYRNGRGLAP